MPEQGRLLGRVPDESLAVATSSGDRRWFGHTGCASDAGRGRAGTSRASKASKLEAALAEPLPDAREGPATMLAILAKADLSSYGTLAAAQRELKRAHTRILRNIEFAWDEIGEWRG
jgi:hypothetical protein